MSCKGILFEGRLYRAPDTSRKEDSALGMSQILSTDRTGQIEFRLLTEERIEDALSVFMETMRSECIAIGVGMFEETGAPEQMQSLFRQVIKDGLTVIGVDRNNGRIAAVSFNKIQVRPRASEKDPLSVFIEENLVNEQCLELVRFLDHVESRVDLFERYRTDSAVEIFYVGTNPKYQGRGIGSEIIRASVDLCRGLRTGRFQKQAPSGELTNPEIVPGLVFGVFASEYSQRIVARLGFECIATVRYENYVCRGKRMSERIGTIHETAKLAALEL